MEEYRKYEPVFGSWYLSKLIGKGSFGKVYEIRREEFGTVYKAALKIISIPQDDDDIKSRMAEFSSDVKTVSEYYEDILKVFINENAIMSQLKGNSYIVSYEDHQIFRHDDGIGYDILIRMELLTPLLDRMMKRSLEEREVIKLGIDMCNALEVCHRKNIIHRDIKPQNIFISDNGDFKLGDFGIARTMEKTTGGMSKKGTYKYMAPEVFRGDDYDETADIYSLGIVLYSLLNGNRGPFLPAPPARVSHADEENARMRRFRGEELPDPAAADNVLAHIIRKACAFVPEERYRSAEQMRKDLESYLNDYAGLSERVYAEELTALTVTDEKTIVVDTPDTGGDEVRRVRFGPGRRKVIAAVLISVLLMGAAGMAFLIKSHITAEQTPEYPAGAVEFNGHMYKIVDEPMYWTQARAACEEQNGHLMTITSQDEQDFIKEQIEDNGISKHYWLGATDEETEGDWRWITGESMTYKNWCENQPNNNIDVDPAGQNYMELGVTCGNQGMKEYMTWNDICDSGVSIVNGVSHEEGPDYCSTKYYGYICEWDSPEQSRNE